MNKLVRDDEELLIARSQRGDVSAFNQLVLCHQQAVFGTIFRMLGDPELAADLTQDAFISAFRAINTFRGGASFRSWLLRIGSNLACDHWRRTQRHPAESLDALRDEDEPSASSLLSSLAISGPEGNPEETLLTHELQDLIQRGLQLLPLDQRVAVVLCDMEGLSYDEIATTTETTLGTVRSRIARGRAKLRLYLSRHQELLPRNYRLTSHQEPHVSHDRGL
ncbi:MAG: sigma-70 family RNA polymerase sigma factor [Chloroflexi bacterium]|nr:MAG: sigma-70 family RNA polymerase sigma factor [Chloroflexota bacterium]